MDRHAVDQTAEKYWSDYFGPYGKAWTKKVPRRVAAAIAEQLLKTASKDAPSATIVKAHIAPLGWAQTATGGLVFEGAFRGTARDGATVHHLFAAEFSANGDLTNLQQLAA